MTRSRRRLLLSVSPQILSDTLLRVLDGAGVDDVVVVTPGARTAAEFDGAIVSGTDSVLADVVIRLPGDSSTQGLLQTRVGDSVIGLTDLNELVELLDEHVTGTASRSAWLRRQTD